MKSTKTILILFGIMLLTIFGLVAYIIISEPVPVVEPFDEGPLREEIRLKDSVATFWEAESATWQEAAKIAEDKVDSLETLKQPIYENHSDQIKFNASATDQQLDSVIRANW